MNYLAHLYLADRSADSVLGSLLGDFMRGADLSRLPEAVLRGIRRHRGVDAFTDSHPVVARSRQRLSGPFQRYAGVMVDVFYDHFLARSWERYSPILSLHDFARGVYAALLSRVALMPPRLREIAPRMAEGDWLAAYADSDAAGRALAGMSRRLRHANPLAKGAAELDAHYADLAQDFDEYFPRLVDHVCAREGVSPRDCPPRLDAAPA
ncbi:MAG: DUF479 domain-containing protein [Planctomycetes bacterium]|nr:DUF479 domain-containing protein [Planctomycetota bacterium]